MASWVVGAAEVATSPDKDVSDSSSSALVIDREAQERRLAERRSYLMRDMCTTLASDLRHMFVSGQLTRAVYDRDILFTDPLTSVRGIDVYAALIGALRAFNTRLDLHTCEVVGEDTVVARWSMDLTAWMLPWAPTITITGTTTYLVDLDSGRVVQHVDTWDAISHQEFISLEGLVHLMRQALQLQLTPRLDSCKYRVLLKTGEYEVRSYTDFLVAATNMGPVSGPASGAGFTALAAYVGGANDTGAQLEMTTPVLTAVAPGQQGACMEFVMEHRYLDVSQLPAPTDGRVALRGVHLGYCAVARFTGWPLDHEVVSAELALRAALVRDGLDPEPGYRLARYATPTSTTPPFLRRNEVIIRLPGFTWPLPTQTR